MVVKHLLLAVAAIGLASSAQAQSSISDPTGDFLLSYTGPHQADLDVTSLSVSYNATAMDFLIQSTFAGAIDPTLPGFYVIGVNTGTGGAPFGAIGAPNSNMQSGYGIAQWTGSRKQDYLDYCSANRLDPSSEQANYGFLKHELQTTQAGAIDAIKNTQSAQDATVAFCNTFERPGDPQMSSRLADLQYVLTA